MDNQLMIPMSEIEKMALAVAKSGLFGIKTPEQGIALMLIAQAEGLHPALAARDYDIIQGRPALKARAMQARFQQSGGKVEWITRTDTEAEALFSHPHSPKPVSVRWDMERAKQAGLGGKDNWRKFPRQMLSARVISEGVAACYPAATSGLYVPEEVSDFDAAEVPAKTRKPKADIQEAEIVPATVQQEPPKNAAPVPVVETEKGPATVPPPESEKTQPESPKQNSGAEVAEQLKKIRALAVKWGARNQEEIRELVGNMVGRKIASATELCSDERQKVVADLEDAIKQQESEVQF